MLPMYLKFSYKSKNYHKPAWIFERNYFKLCCLFLGQTDLGYFWQLTVKHNFTGRSKSFCISVTQAPTSNACTIKIINNCSIIGDDTLTVIIPW